MENLLEVVERELAELTVQFISNYSDDEQYQLAKHYTREMLFAHDEGAMWALGLVRDFIKENVNNG